MSKASEMRDRARRVTGRSETAAAATVNEGVQEPALVATVPKRTPSVRAAPVRITADLPPQHYRELIAYAAGLAAELGKVKVAHVQVVRALVVELAENEELQRRIAVRVARQLDL